MGSLSKLESNSSVRILQGNLTINHLHPTQHTSNKHNLSTHTEHARKPTPPMGQKGGALVASRGQISHIPGFQATKPHILLKHTRDIL